MKLLVVEDDDQIADELVSVLTGSGMSVCRESDGEVGYLAGIREFSAIILDLGLPSVDGLTVLRRWRQAGVATPVLALTARGGWMERVEGLDAGADDYLPKPFHMEELLARLRVLLRRGPVQPEAVLRHGDLVIETRQRRAFFRGEPVPLTRQELKALTHLVANQGRVVSAQELILVVHGDENAVSSNAVEAMIGRARRKLGIDLIETRRGFGYIVPEDRV